MLADGYLVCGYHGPTPQAGVLNDLAIPPVLRGIRPDVLAIGPDRNSFALGEAKTVEDLCSAHSRRQFEVLATLAGTKEWVIRIYIAVPRSAATTLDKALARAGLAGKRGLVRLHIPDCLISEDSSALA
jgi:hypothetical protein